MKVSGFEQPEHIPISASNLSAAQLEAKLPNVPQEESPDTGISKSYLRDLRLILSGSDSKREQTLAVVILASHYRPCLCCSLKNSDRYLRPDTPADFLVFYLQDQAHQFEGFQKNCTVLHHFLPIFPEHWRKLSWLNITSDNSWSWQMWDLNYRMMGQWRLKYCFQILRNLGYKYALQLDDDSHILSPISMNILELAVQKQIDVGGIVRSSDPAIGCWGLPEIARYFLMSEKYEPVGPLWEHCNPHNIAGLVSTHAENYSKFSEAWLEGWDCVVVKGYFVLMHLDFYLSPIVQSFVNLVINSGGSMQFRWNEQGVFGMMTQMFVREENYYDFSRHFVFKHSKDCL